MIALSLKELAVRCGGELHAEDQPVLGFATDSREAGPGMVFLAIKGAKVDGHDFAPQVMQAGAAAILAERPLEGPHILVPNLVSALAQFGAGLRNEFVGPVIGVTGSAGKTTTKEFVAAALSPRGTVLKNKGNRNTEYTSPLLWTEKRETDWAAVVEMGMRGFGQIKHLAEISRPTLAVITMVGTAHIEMVGSREGIARAKGEILEGLPSDGHAVFWAEDDFLMALKGQCAVPVSTFGFSPEADCRITGYRALTWKSSLVEGLLDGVRWQSELGILGRHHARNAAAGLLAGVRAGVPLAESADALSSAELPPMRMEAVERDGVTFLVDAYNASPDSTCAALQALAEIPAKGQRCAVLGEMRELGDYTERGHRLVGQALAAAMPDSVLLTGGPTHWIAEEALKGGFPESRLVLLESLDLGFVRRFLEETQPGDVALIKGSRALGLESAIPKEDGHGV